MSSSYYLLPSSSAKRQNVWLLAPLVLTAVAVTAVGASPIFLHVATNQGLTRAGFQSDIVRQPHTAVARTIIAPHQRQNVPIKLSSQLGHAPNSSGTRTSVVSWCTMLAGMALAVFAAQRSIAMLSASGVRHAVQPFLDIVRDPALRQKAESVSQEMEQAEQAGNEDKVLEAGSVLGGLMMTVSLEAVKQAVKVTLACGTITTRALIEKVLLHASPPAPEADGSVKHTLPGVMCRGRYWRIPELWAVVPTLKVLHDCEEEFKIDLGEVLLELLECDMVTVSYAALENKPEEMTDIEHKVLVYLVTKMFDIPVPYPQP